MSVCAKADTGMCPNLILISEKQIKKSVAKRVIA